jgi:ABC-type multidrug transport system ATPase subunit
LTVESIERVQLGDAARRKIAGYSKGMRQKVRLAQAIAHHPRVLVLDEPLNGLDPMARAESIALFQELGRQGMHLLISSHILDEVDRISDRVVLITGGYLVAEGSIQQVGRKYAKSRCRYSFAATTPRCSHRRCSRQPLRRSQIACGWQRRLSFAPGYRSVLFHAQRNCGGGACQNRVSRSGRR